MALYSGRYLWLVRLERIFWESPWQKLLYSYNVDAAGLLTQQTNQSLRQKSGSCSGLLKKMRVSKKAEGPVGRKCFQKALFFGSSVLSFFNTLIVCSLMQADRRFLNMWPMSQYERHSHLPVPVSRYISTCLRDRQSNQIYRNESNLSKNPSCQPINLWLSWLAE